MASQQGRHGGSPWPCPEYRNPHARLPRSRKDQYGPGSRSGAL